MMEQGGEGGQPIEITLYPSQTRQEVTVENEAVELQTDRRRRFGRAIEVQKFDVAERER